MVREEVQVDGAGAQSRAGWKVRMDGDVERAKMQSVIETRDVRKGLRITSDDGG